MNNQKILIFAGSRLGYHCVKYLVEEKVIPDKVIISETGDSKLAGLCARNNVSYEYYSDETQARLVIDYDKGGDVLCSFWSPYIIQNDLLLAFKKTLNIHPSLVPLQRGNDCATWCLLEETDAGVSLMEISSKLDAGGFYIQEKYEKKPNERGRDLHNKLINLGITLFKRHWYDIFNGKLNPIPQVGVGSYHRRADTNRDRVRDGLERDSLESTLLWILAHDHYPKSTAEVIMGDTRYKITLRMTPVKRESEVENYNSL